MLSLPPLLHQSSSGNYNPHLLFFPLSPQHQPHFSWDSCPSSPIFMAPSLLTIPMTPLLPWTLWHHSVSPTSMTQFWKIFLAFFPPKKIWVSLPFLSLVPYSFRPNTPKSMTDVVLKLPDLFECYSLCMEYSLSSSPKKVLLLLNTHHGSETVYFILPSKSLFPKASLFFVTSPSWKSTSISFICCSVQMMAISIWLLLSSYLTKTPGS